MKVELSMPESASQYSFAVRNVLCKDNLDKLFLTIIAYREKQAVLSHASCMRAHRQGSARYKEFEVRPV